MGRIVLIVLIVLVVIFLVRGFGRSREHGGARGEPKRPARDERMVQCSHCGVYIPEAAAVESGGAYFCSDEHRRLSAK